MTCFKLLNFLHATNDIIFDINWCRAGLVINKVSALWWAQTSLSCLFRISPHWPSLGWAGLGWACNYFLFIMLLLPRLLNMFIKTTQANIIVFVQPGHRNYPLETSTIGIIARYFHWQTLINWLGLVVYLFSKCKSAKNKVTLD